MMFSECKITPCHEEMFFFFEVPCFYGSLAEEVGFDVVWCRVVCPGTALMGVIFRCVVLFGVRCCFLCEEVGPVWWGFLCGIGCGVEAVKWPNNPKEAM